MFLLCPKVINLLILIRAASFLPFLQCDNTYSSHFKSLSMRTPKSFCCLLSQIFVAPTCTNNLSYLYADRARQIARPMPIECARAGKTSKACSIFQVFTFFLTKKKKTDSQIFSRIGKPMKMLK